MKKIGKKLSFLTKIMLVVGLLVSNLSSLSVVFAYEAIDDVVITKEEANLKIKYTELLAEEVNEVRVDVYESYTYLDDETTTLDVVSYQLDEEQMASAKLGELELTHPITTFKLFDGTYKMVVKFYKLVESLPQAVNELGSLETETPEVTEELITTATYTEEVTYNSGLSVSVYDNNDIVVNAVDGKYPMAKENTNASIEVSVLSGGLAPSDTFMYNEVSYTAEELLEEKIPYNYDFAGKLYGEYKYPISVELLKLVTTEETDTSVEPEYENVTYSKNVKFMYGTYADNTNVLNETLVDMGMNDAYYFVGNSKNGVLYNVLDLTSETVTVGNMLDLYNLLEVATDETEVSYKLYKGELDLILEYNNTYGNIVTPVTEGETTTTPVVTLGDYLSEIILDGTVKVTLTSEDETISYSLVVRGDINGDNLVNESDVEALIELLVTGTNNVNGDVYGTDGVNSKDVLYLQLVLENKDWNVTVADEDATLDAELNTDLSTEDTLVSGDVFEVDYTLKLSTNEVSGFSGKFDYDKEVLELVSVESLIDGTGYYDKETGKFFYLGSESLDLPETETPVVQEETSELTLTSETESTVVTADYAVVRAKFRVLKSGTHTVSVKDTEYYNLNTYLNVQDSESTVTVEVLQSDDNTLSYLEVAGKEIELVEDVYEYELTVKNEVTLVDLRYILSNIAASVVSTIYPEELVVGTNEITITVSSESGLTQEYKVVVTREEEVKTTTQVNYGNYQPNYQEPVVEEPVIPSEPEEPVVEKESNLSKIIIMVLIVLVIGGLVYLIFKDDEEEEVKVVNKKIDRLKKDSADFEVKSTKNTNTTKSTSNKSSAKKKTNNKKNNNKKER